MRKILFRGKRADNGEWVYGNLNYGTIEIENIKDSYYISDFNVNPWDKKFYPVIPESVGQYTGLTDKNGNKIFEGDIVEFKSKNYSKALSCRRIVTFGNGCFLLKNIKTGVHTNFIMYQREYCVIGNIYDNPELLEVK